MSKANNVNGYKFSPQATQTLNRLGLRPGLSIWRDQQDRISLCLGWHRLTMVRCNAGTAMYVLLLRHRKRTAKARTLTGSTNPG